MSLLKVNIKFLQTPLQTANPNWAIPVIGEKLYYMTAEELSKLQDVAKENDIRVELLPYGPTTAKGVLGDLPALKQQKLRGQY